MVVPVRGKPTITIGSRIASSAISGCSWKWRSAESLAKLNALGQVKHVVRLGDFHGLDDDFYVSRYGAQFWRAERAEAYPKPAPTKVLEEGGALPFGDAELFRFRLALKPEAAILWRRHGGVLITCDSLQHYESWRHCTLPARLVMTVLGFRKATLIGPLWLKAVTPKGGSLEPDFDRLLKLDFDHLIAAHGQFRRGGAKQGVREAVARVFAG